MCSLLRGCILTGCISTIGRSASVVFVVFVATKSINKIIVDCFANSLCSVLSITTRWVAETSLV